MLNMGDTLLEFRRLRSDRGFMVYVTQAYPSLKPYLKGFHLSLETWRGRRNDEGWKEHPQLVQVQDEQKVAGDALTNDELKIQHLVESTLGKSNDAREPPSGMTQAAPRFKADLEALLFLTQSEKPIL